MSEADLATRLRVEVGRLTVRPAGEFVAARTDRVKELKADGEAELARELAAQRRPTVAAWAADQLAHRHADELDELFAAADRVRTTQSASDPDRAAVREATVAFTAQVRRLRGLAADRLAEAGTTPDPHLDEVEATLLAAATDEQVAADLRAGALLRPAPSPGFAALASLAPSGGDRGGNAAVAGTAAPRAGDGDDAAAAARRAEEQAAAEARRLEEERAALRERRTELTSRRDQVASDLAAAEADLAAAEAAAQRARDALADLGRQLADLDRQEAELPHAPS